MKRTIILALLLFTALATAQPAAAPQQAVPTLSQERLARVDRLLQQYR